MRRDDKRKTETPAGAIDCTYCGRPIDSVVTVSERFGEPFCSEAHAEKFAEGVRQARIAAVVQRETEGACSLPAAGQRAWKDYVKRGACWGAPLLLLLALPLFWSASALGTAGGSLLTVLAALACPLGMYFVMRAMTTMSHHDPPARSEPPKEDPTRKALGVVLLAAGVAAAPVAYAGELSRATAPAFEHVHALALDASGRALWLGAHTGLYRSEDGGRTWAKTALQAGDHAHDVMAIAAHPSEADVLYIGTHEAGVLKTADGGRTWTPVNAGLGGLDVHGLAVDPNTPAKLHALVREKGSGVYRTTDGGKRWVRVDDGPAGETKLLASVNIPTGMGGIFLYAGTAEGLQRNPDCF